MELEHCPLRVYYTQNTLKYCHTRLCAILLFLKFHISTYTTQICIYIIHLENRQLYRLITSTYFATLIQQYNSILLAVFRHLSPQKAFILHQKCQHTAGIVPFSWSYLFVIRCFNPILCILNQLAYTFFYFS